MDALGGWIFVTGEPDREPVKPGLFQAQYSAGLNAAIHTIAALNVRQATGEGRTIDVSVMETAAHFVGMGISMYSSSQDLQVPRRQLDGHAQGLGTARAAIPPRYTNVRTATSESPCRRKASGRCSRWPWARRNCRKTRANFRRQLRRAWPPRPRVERRSRALVPGANAARDIRPVRPVPYPLRHGLHRARDTARPAAPKRRLLPTA